MTNLIVNGGFDSDLSGWLNDNTYWQWSNGRAYHPSGDAFNKLWQQDILTPNTRYVLAVDVDHPSGGYYRIQLRGSAGDAKSILYSGGDSMRHVIYFTTEADETSIAFARHTSGVASEFYIDDVVIMEYFTGKLVLDYSLGPYCRGLGNCR